MDVKSTHNDELYCLRTLLQHVRGCRSFVELRTVRAFDSDSGQFETIVCDTYREACVRRGLFANSDIFERAMQQASTRAAPYRLRNFFLY